MFDRLSTRLQSAFRNLRGYGRISEKNVQDALREVRMALLEADVHYATAKEFIERVNTKSVGAEVLESVTPGQQIIKAIHDELVALLGGEQQDFNLSAIPSEVMLLGLHMVFFVHNPKRFAFILSLMIIFLGVVVLLALIDVIEIARKNLTGKRDTFRDTLGDDAFIHELGRRVNNEQENERSGKET